VPVPVVPDHPDIEADFLPGGELVGRGLGDRQVHSADRPHDLQSLLKRHHGRFLVTRRKLIGADSDDQGLPERPRVLDDAQMATVEEVERAAGVDDWSLHFTLDPEGWMPGLCPLGYSHPPARDVVVPSGGHRRRSRGTRPAAREVEGFATTGGVVDVRPGGPGGAPGEPAPRPVVLPAGVRPGARRPTGRRVGRVRRSHQRRATAEAGPVGAGGGGARPAAGAPGGTRAPPPLVAPPAVAAPRPGEPDGASASTAPPGTGPRRRL